MSDLRAEHDSLVESILDEPDDDARRLVYADWLEEHGDFRDAIRAQLLRLQVREQPHEFGSPEWGALHKETSRFELRYAWLMSPALPPGFTFQGHDRGLILVRVSSTAPRFVEWGEDYHGGLPPYCRLTLDLSRPPARGKFLKLLDSAAFPLVSVLTLRNYAWQPQEVTRLAADPRVRYLAEIQLYGGSGLGNAELAVLANSPHFSRLSELTLYGDPIDDAGLVALATGTGMPRLEMIRLAGPPNTHQWAQAFTKHRPKLKFSWPSRR